jgi:hypothetical protein
MALGEANIFESELELFEPLCIVVTHVLMTTAVTEIPERRPFKQLHMLSFFCCRTMWKFRSPEGHPLLNCVRDSN